MEHLFDEDLIGEVVIPMEPKSLKALKTNYPDKSNQEVKDMYLNNVKSLVDNSYTQFRSTIFFGEYLNFYVLIKSDNMKNILDHLYVKIDFDVVGGNQEKELLSKDIDNAILFIDENKDANLGYNFSDAFSLTDNSSNNLLDSEHKNNFNTDLINLRLLLDSQSNNDESLKDKESGESKIAILEISKYISIPNNLINRNILLKVNLLKKNYYSDDIQLSNKQKNLNSIFESRVYNFNEEFTPIKTFFKEIKVIRPVSISSVTQFDLSPDSCLIQFQFKNITNNVCFIDESLKSSKFLKGNNTASNNDDVKDKFNANDYKSKNINKEFGIDLELNDCQVLKEESTIESKTIIDIQKSEQIVCKDDIPFDNFEFLVLNKNFPYNLKAGEEFNLCIKISKTLDSFDNFMDRIKDINNHNEMVSMKFTHSLMPKAKVNLIDHEGKTVLVTYNKGSKEVSFNYQNLNKQNNLTNDNPYMDTISRIDTESKQFFLDDRRSIYTQMLNDNQSVGFSTTNNSKAPKVSTLINNINLNILKRQTVNKGKRTSRVVNTYDSSNQNPYITTEINQTNPLSTIEKVKETDKQLSTIRDKENETSISKNKTDNLNKITENLIKLLIRTPLLISIKAKKCYDSLYMNIPVIWKTEFSNFINVEMIVKSKPIIHNNFTVQLFIKNLGNKVIDLELKIEGNEKNLLDDSEKDNCNSLLCEFKSKKIGELDPFQQRIIEVSFMPIKEGFLDFPHLTFIDRKNNLLFSSLNKNRIFIFSN